jgi:predicted Ser/Thr protein kinase
MKEIKEYINDELSKLDRSLVATPDRNYLIDFSKANQGSNDLLLMEMSIKYGYKLALENLKKELK